MYYPYFRGKQYELITIRETAPTLAAANFVPVIEPVKETLQGLKRALDAVVAADGKAIVIINPFHGDHSSNGENISSLLNTEYQDKSAITVGILLTGEMSADEIIGYSETHASHDQVLIHSGYSDSEALARVLESNENVKSHIFIEKKCGELYRGHFRGKNRILVKDGFKQQTNRDYPDVEHFSDLHVLYEEKGLDGFGDFLIVGDDYKESGGPAYAVAIHITFIDDEKDKSMHVYHFKSDRQDTPQDPAGKFAEALNKLVTKVNDKNTKIYRTDAISEFLDLHKKGHFPGLGYVKKLSMQHHIQTFTQYFEASE